MHAYLYITSDQAKSVSEFLETNNFEKVNTTKHPLKKVQDVRDIIKRTNYSFKAKTLIIVEDFDKASIVAQNAFLKRLEEPQKNLTFLLTASDESKILDTILSRCLVKHLRFDIEKEEAETLWGKDINEMFEFINNIKTREEAASLLKSMLSSKDKNISKLKYVLETLDRIEKNANTNLQLTNLVVKLH